MTDLSIIIPIYNTPTDALQHCFDSLHGLSGLSWEAILVDDGSESLVGDFCRSYEAQDSHFRYFRKENGGVSSARNTGLDHAQGTYIAFVDADDTLISDHITPDVMVYPLVIYDIELNGGLWKVMEQPKGILTPWQLHQHLTASKTLNSPCAKLFLRRIIEEHHLRFDTDFVTAEDWNFVWDYCCHIETAFYTAECCYRYFRDSSTSTTRVRKFPDVMVSNHISVFYKKQSMLPALYPNENTSPALHTAAAMVAEDLFNMTADMYLLKILTKTRKNQARAHIRSIIAKYPALPKKAALKAWVLGHCWAALPLLAVIRKQYIK